MSRSCNMNPCSGNCGICAGAPSASKPGRITRRDTTAAAAICEALGIRADRCREIRITISAPGTFLIEHTSWVDDPKGDAIAEQFKRMGPQS